MIHMNCRGYAVAQFMQPEPAKYAHAPMLEAKTFMQPEQGYYAHHPGRFCYLKDEHKNVIYSVPYEPVRSRPDSFSFSAGKSDILWKVQYGDFLLEMSLTLPVDDALELWTLKINNRTTESKKASVYPYFPVGYMSWMNQSGKYEPELQAIVCSSISPYQKYEDYAKIKDLKDKTFLIAEQQPTSWEVNQASFEGEGGLHYPTGLQHDLLQKGQASYESPACVFQYQLELEAAQGSTLRFIFGPAKHQDDIKEIRKKYFPEKNQQGMDGFQRAGKLYQDYIEKGEGCFQIKSPDPVFQNFVNHWLPRQVYYHGESNRLSTDPQTRNYLQDNMGMSYIKPETARDAFITALSQQKINGEMPDGILLYENAELKYINQVPHSDHCVWLPICLKAYLDETNDYDLLSKQVPFANSNGISTLSGHISRAMDWLVKNRDERGLSYIDQGDWNDPMNMVGYKGKGVSGWLTMATSYALQVWADICENHQNVNGANGFRTASAEMNDAINKHLWDGKWYARGITDNNVLFGIKEDNEGRIFLNTQSWALLCGCADKSKTKSLIEAVEEQLETPYGVELVTPAFTAMREDIGRVTQKYPGYAENGSVYNHAAAFYIYALYSIGEYNRAYRILRKMIPGPDVDDIRQRGQMPVFIPNYYRGAFRQFPETAGRSSQLFNTGTASWIYRCLIDGLLGLQGTRDGLKINPQLPDEWDHVQVTRYYSGAEFNIQITRVPELERMSITVDGELLKHNIIENIEKNTVYNLTIRV